MSAIPIDQNAIVSKVEEVKAAIENPAVIAGLAGAAGLAAGVGVGIIASGNSSSPKRKRRKKSSKKRRSSRRARRSSRRRGRRTPRTAGKGRDRSTKRIRYTKNGQPYVIMRSGKARFIKKRGARASHRRKGGRY